MPRRFYRRPRRTFYRSWTSGEMLAWRLVVFLGASLVLITLLD